MSKEFLYIPSAYKEGKTYSAIPNVSEADLGSFTRGSSATRVNEQGLIELVGNDIPRIDYSDGGCPKLLLEDSAENLVEYSEDFSQWSDIGNSTNITTGQESITQESFSSLISMPVGSGTYLGNNISATIDQEYTISVWAKNNTGDSDVTIGFGSSSSNPTSKSNLVLNLTDEWKRYELSFVSDVNGVLGYGIDNKSNTRTLNAFFYGFQLETGSVATSYIPTNGATATRQADSGLQTGDIQSYIDSKNLTFEVSDISLLIGGNDFTEISLSDGTSDTRIIFSYVKSLDRVRAVLVKTGETSLTLNFNNARVFDAKSIKVEVKDGYATFRVNEVMVDNNSFFGFSEDELSTISLNNGAGNNQIYAKIGAIRVSDKEQFLFNSWQEISNSLSNRGYRII